MATINYPITRLPNPRSLRCFFFGKSFERLVEQGDRAGIDLRRTAEGYGLTVTVGFYLAAKPTR